MEKNIIGQPALQPIGGQVLSEESFNLDDPVFVNDADIVDDSSVNEEGHPYFIEGPASSYTYEDLQKMTIPVFAATNELSIANTDIAKAVYSAAAKVFGLENLSPLEFRGSHMRKARIVSAQDLKEAPEDQEDKTTSYLERLACCFTVKSYDNMRTRDRRLLRFHSLVPHHKPLFVKTARTCKPLVCETCSCVFKHVFICEWPERRRPGNVSQ